MPSSPWRGPTSWEYPASHDLNSSNRPVRTRMPGGVAGERSVMIAPYADLQLRIKRFSVSNQERLFYVRINNINDI